MSRRAIRRIVLVAVFFIFTSFLPGQSQNQSGIKWYKAAPRVIGLAAFIFGVYLYLRRLKDRQGITRAEHKEKREIEKEEQTRQFRTDDQKYRKVLRKELGSIRMIGPEFESQSITLEESFVSLRLSQTWLSEKRFGNGKIELHPLPPGDIHLSAEEVMKQTFPKFQLLLIAGDPGSGKTTLLKYYALTCLDNKQHILGFGDEDLLPVYFPLRELEFSRGCPIPLHENLQLWTKNRHLNISSQEFYNWLNSRKTLVLLDGLDEISDLEKRKQVCQWIESGRTGLENAYFVLTTRPTGYRKLEGLELACDHMRADILDFSQHQQERFLNQWFRAVFLNELPVGVGKDVKEQVEKTAAHRAGTIIDFLNKEENKSVRELAAVPMLLQIMAIIWKDRDYFPDSRGALYDISLNYLLEYRDKRRNLAPILPAEKARKILAPAALLLQETLRSDHAKKDELHNFMQPILNTTDKQPDARDFCENLRDRAGLIADYGGENYIFRHKSFLEFLAALQLGGECLENHERIDLLIDSFPDDWWEESLRFFISKSDDKMFDRFMHRFFRSDVSRHLDANKQTLLQNLVKEAPQKKIDALVKALNNKELNDNRQRYVMDCLKTVGTPEAAKAIKVFIDKSEGYEAILDHARDIAADLFAQHARKGEKPVEKAQFITVRESFRNPIEDDVEYIKIPGGTYRYSVSKGMVTVPDLYFCKYPVTNKRYRRFISFLEGREKEFPVKLPVTSFADKLIQFSKSIKGYPEYLGSDIKQWPEKLRSKYDDNKKYNSDDQPAVGITWYMARAYCFWLSCLAAAIDGGEKLEDIKDIDRLASIYRLPMETEWEWAAGGEPDGTIRGYPWSREKGGPNPNLADYDGNVGATTPVGRYPEGATPHGLMDMAGNVWEWMENYYDKNEDAFALRGGSWLVVDTDLCCSARDCIFPDDWNGDLGFRVLCGFAPREVSWQLATGKKHQVNNLVE